MNKIVFSPIQWQGRFDAIDALRGIAALCIVLYHMTLLPQPNLVVSYWDRVALNGGAAVSLFFIMSGFCLELSKQKHKQDPQPTVRFFLRRIFRIIPLFYFWLLLTLMLHKYMGISHSWKVVLLNVLLVFNFVPGQHDGLVMASWILSVEMLFYVLFPVISLYINDYRKAIGFFFLTLIVSIGYSRMLAGVTVPEIQQTSFLHYSFLHQLPFFAFGMLCFFIYQRFIQAKFNSRGWALIMVVAGITGYLTLRDVKLNFIIETLYWQNMVFGSLFLGLIIYPLGLFVNRLTRFYGEISYSVYLNHPMLIVLLIPVYRAIYTLHLPVVIQFGACAALTIVLLTPLSYYTYRYIEQPGALLGHLVAQQFEKRILSLKKRVTI